MAPAAVTEALPKFTSASPRYLLVDGLWRSTNDSSTNIPPTIPSLITAPCRLKFPLFPDRLGFSSCFPQEDSASITLAAASAATLACQRCFPAGRVGRESSPGSTARSPATTGIAQTHIIINTLSFCIVRQVYDNRFTRAMPSQSHLFPRY